MLGGIVVGFMMIAPFVSLLLAAVILLGMISLAVAGAVESRKERVGISVAVPRVEKAG